MSIQSSQNNIERIQRDISSLQRKLTEETKNEASKNERIYQIRQSITPTTSLSTIQSKQREIERLERDIVSIQKKKVDLTKNISDKTSELHRYQQQLFREQESEQKKLMDLFKRKEEQSKLKQEELLNQVRISTQSTLSPFLSSIVISSVKYDAFISHASEDKEILVRPLAEKLEEAGFSVWYDEFKLKVGDSLRRSIDKGLANSRFGIVVLSPSFFAKNWTQYELDGLVAKEMTGGKVILPLWHKVSKDEVMAYSPTLADKVALNTAMFTTDELVKELSDVLK
ncbi:MAG: TIR domain-containing protein [Nostoc sp. ChiQUE02]|uniref:toll/interleukin-1 receptor domain-containing protein n=1 Tax=Nostoc sp. ChiQUE02 TaxID=3075377 RepID=UPI002AD32DD1|nr:TIR domain-containing protein [Nostoc sp. ChiQUE02]MDZ8228914.1 TIR domain-containing protein [Nostoc sp. ChiQUE02]